MTEETAKKVFDILLFEIRANGFTDIGTFMIDEVQKENEYEEFDDKYEYIDTEKIMSNFEVLSAKPQSANYALMKLVDAGIEYFSLATRIPDNYAEKLYELSNGKNISSKINLETINEGTVNIDTALKNKSIDDLIGLLKKVRIGFDQDDETFINSFQ
ncbi:MAG: hypothetical protein V4683_05715 [Bacteroidota bacterium]